MAGGADLKKIQWEYISYFQYSKKHFIIRYRASSKAAHRKYFVAIIE